MDNEVKKARIKSIKRDIEINLFRDTVKQRKERYKKLDKLEKTCFNK